MTLGEFTAWLDGFEESFDDAPSAKQWKAIRKKFKTVPSPPTHTTVINTDYYRLPRYEKPYQVWCSAGLSARANATGR